MPRFLTTTTTVLCLMIVTLVHAGDPKGLVAPHVNNFCRKLLGDSIEEPTLNDFLRPRPDFNHVPDDYVYQRQLGCNLMARNQFPLGTCWAHVNLRLLEIRAFNAVGKYTPLSSDFLIISKLLYSTMEAIKTRNSNITMSAGLLAASEVIGSYGLVPSELWQPKVALNQSKPVMQRLLFHLKMIVRNARIELNKIRSHGQEQLKATLARIESQVLECVEAFAGPLPTQFTFEGQSHTPLSFAALPRFAPPPAIDFGLDRHLVEAKDPEKLLRRIRAQIDATKEPVAISIAWVPAFIDSQTGIASISAFTHYNSTSLEDLELIARAALDSDVGPSHELLIEDYSLNSKNEVTKLWALNSHGPSFGDGGHLHLYKDYFLAFIKRAALLEGY